MILDYTFSKQDKRFEVSYITEKGQKSFLTFDNLSRFKTYYYTPAGEFDTYDGAKAGICYTDSPSKFDIKEYLTELPDQYKSLISQKTYPKLYTFDIETKISETGEFPDPAIAKQEITTISVVSPDLNAIVFGTKQLSQEELAYCEKSFKEYVEANEFFQTLKKPTPTFQYILCDNEKEMLRLFLTRIVAKVSILAGWNSILFDWQYIVNRIKNNYPMLSLKLASCTKQLTKKRFTSRLGDKIDLPMPVHTLILDMMDIIKDDITIMPIKESLGLDYIASESVKANKIKYDGTLQDLYNNDYKNYVFYNCIDSVLVQLIDYRFRCLELYYQYALYCNEKIGNCFSPIALTESLVFKDFYENGVKIVYQKAETPERTPLIGAYVKVPIPGKYKFICCNDFASLYPSTIITCNISFENYVGAFYDEEKLEYFRKQEGKYLIIGGQVYKNDGKPNKPSIGEFVGNFIDEKRLEKYKKDKNYFVSVNGHVYRNDKEYTFKRIQRKLKAERNIDKYLGKKIEAEVVTDIRHLIKGANEKLHIYEQDIIESLEQLGYKGYSCGEDFRKLSVEELKDAERIIYAECKFKESHQMAMKLLGNSMYGGCSHVAFYFYNMNLANDITGEARNVIHMMEHHIPKYFEDNWFDMKAEHKRWGIEVDQSLRGKVKNLCIPIYGDTDSIYSSYQNLLKTIKGIDKMTDSEKLNIILKLNTDFLDKHNFEYMRDYYAKRFVDSVQNFELETIASSGVWLTSKKKYAQILLWKDGTFYDADDLPMKIKGLEVVKSSTSKVARTQLKEIIRKLLEINDTPENETQLMNIEVQKKKNEFLKCDVESVSGSCNVNTYRDYVISDDGDHPEFKPKVPYNVRALALYNNIIKKKHFKEEPIYAGKLKWYIVKSRMKTKDTQYFAFQSKNLPDWSQDFAPIDKKIMFQKQVLDPFNRILESIGYKKLEIDGNIQTDLFSLFM